MISFRGLLLVVLAAATASAGPITWTLNGVTSLGTSITGSFVFNADTDIYSSVNITSSGGTVIPANTWTALAECCATESGFLGLVDTSAANQTGADLLGLFFAVDLTDAGGSVPITETQQGTCSGSTCASYIHYGNDPSGGLNTDVTGSVVANFSTPEPASLILFGGGASFLLLIRKRLRRP
jgi:hypothetical protein